MYFKDSIEYVNELVIKPVKDAIKDLPKEKQDEAMEPIYFICDKYREMNALGNLLESKVTEKISTKEIIEYLEEHCPFVDYEEGDE